eukprot:g5045.t1
MSIAHFDAVRLFRLILTSPFHHALPPSTKSSHLQSSDELYISKSAFLAAMKGPNIDASNTILELLQQSQSQFPVSAAFEGHCFPRHPLGEAEFAEAVVPILQRCRAPSKIYPSAQTLLEEGQLLFNYLDVSAEVHAYAMRATRAARARHGRPCYRCHRVRLASRRCLEPRDRSRFP